MPKWLFNNDMCPGLMAVLAIVSRARQASFLEMSNNVRISIRGRCKIKEAVTTSTPKDDYSTRVGLATILPDRVLFEIRYCLSLLRHNSLSSTEIFTYLY